MIPRFIISLLQGRSPAVFGDGEQSRDFTYIDNVIQANLLAMSADHLHGEVLNIACGERTSLNQLLEVLKGMVGSEISALYQPSREGDVRHSFADVRKAKEVLGYVPCVDPAEGLRKTVEYFRGQPDHGIIE